MKQVYKAMAAATFLLGMRAPVQAAELLNTKDAVVNIGGRFQTMGELENVTTETQREHTRIYLFNTEDRLKANGVIDGVTFHFEEALGGEAMSNTNSQFNLLEFNADVPVFEGLGIVVGQFKVPTNLSSAIYEENMLFTEKSPLNQLFFNQGFDTGAVVHAKYGLFDALAGTIAGAPDMPQRYLPEIFKTPPMLIARLGMGNINDDPFHPVQEGYAKTEDAQWAVHANGLFINDSNAGHSTDLSLQGGYATTFSANSYFSNAILTSSWNPFLGKSLVTNGPVNSDYWNASVDGVYRTTLGDYNFSLQGDWAFSEFVRNNFATMNINGNKVNQAQINISGGELIASVGRSNWALSARVDAVLPDPAFMYYNSTSGYYASILGSDPIYEVTFPSLMIKINSRVKLVGESMFFFNAPEGVGDDGIYELLEMPSQVTNATKINPIIHNAFVSVGRMMFQFAF